MMGPAWRHGAALAHWSTPSPTRTEEHTLDTSLEGRRGQPFTMVLEAGKIREFARATKSSNPAYDGGVHGEPISPVTFLMASAFWQGPGASPLTGVELNWERILHGEQEFRFVGPPPKAGAVLTGQSYIDKVYEKAGKRGGTMAFTEQVTEFRDQSGALVAELRSTMIETSKATTES